MSRRSEILADIADIEAEIAHWEDVIDALLEDLNDLEVELEELVDTNEEELQ